MGGIVGLFLPTGSAVRWTRLHYRFMRDIIYPPVLGTKDDYWSRVGKKGACNFNTAVRYWLEFLPIEERDASRMA